MSFFPGSSKPLKRIALRVAFPAAVESVAVRIGHWLHAARHEHAKLEKSLTDSETVG